MLERFSSDPHAWMLAFRLAASNGDHRQAAIALTITSYLRPLTREEQLQLGDLYAAINVPAQAGALYEQALHEGGTLQEMERLASAYIAARDTEAALRTLERAIEQQPSVRLYSLLGDMYYMEENYALAYQAYQQCSELDPGQGRAILMMGYCALEMGRFEEAVSQLELAADFPELEQTAKSLLKRARDLRS
jgi:tetratricopeptide (TPR) repeat protein